MDVTLLALKNDFERVTANSCKQGSQFHCAISTWTRRQSQPCRSFAGRPKKALPWVGPDFRGSVTEHGNIVPQHDLSVSARSSSVSRLLAATSAVTSSMPISQLASIPAGFLHEADSCGNQSCVLRQNLTNISITGTSISTPTTVANAAPDDRPKSMVAVAMATSK